MTEIRAGFSISEGKVFITERSAFDIVAKILNADPFTRKEETDLLLSVGNEILSSQESVELSDFVQKYLSALSKNQLEITVPEWFNFGPPIKGSFGEYDLSDIDSSERVIPIGLYLGAAAGGAVLGFAVALMEQL